MSFSESPTVCPIISLGVQSGKVSGAGGGISVVASSIVLILSYLLSLLLQR